MTTFGDRGHRARKEEFTGRTDEELLASFTEAAATAQNDIFAVLCDRHLAAVLRYCAHRLHDPHASSDAAQETFLAAFEQLRNGRRPDVFAAWLIGIARNKVVEQFRGVSADGRRRGNADLLTLTGNAETSEQQTLDDLENLSRRRLAEVQRLLDVVAQTLTEKQQRLFDLAMRQELRGEKLGAALGMSAKRASTQTWELIQLMHSGFGALVLARDGRRFCPQLAAILDGAPAEPGFTAGLRERIVRHFGTCTTCDACVTCERERARLVLPYTPVLVPLLVLGVTRQAIDDRLRPVAASAPLVPPRPGPPRTPGRRRRLPLLLVPLAVLLLVVGGVVVVRLIGSGPPPPSLAGTWTLTPFNERGGTGPSRTPSWSFNGTCETADTCAFTWIPLTSTTTFETEFTQDFRDSAKQQVPPGLPQNISPDLVVRPSTGGTAYGGQATAQYGIFNEAEQTFATGQETVILTLVILDSTTSADGRTVATQLSVNVTFAAHDFEPCTPQLCGRQSFDDLKQTLTATATRTG